MGATCIHLKGRDRKTFQNKKWKETKKSNVRKKRTAFNKMRSELKRQNHKIKQNGEN